MEDNDVKKIIANMYEQNSVNIRESKKRFEMLELSHQEIVSILKELISIVKNQA